MLQKLVKPAALYVLISLGTAVVILTIKAHHTLVKLDQFLVTVNETGEFTNKHLPVILSDVRGATRDGRVAIKAMRDEWESEDYQRARRNAIMSGEMIGAHLLRDTLPKADALLDQAVNTTKTLNESANNLSAFIAHTDTSVNAELLPEVKEVLRNVKAIAENFNVEQQSLLAEIGLAVHQGRLSVEQVNHLLTTAQPTLIEALGHVNGSTAEIEQTLRNLTGASTFAPQLAKQINQILVTANQAKRASMIVGLLIQIARGVFF
jgi:hypothetical protein